MAHVTLHLGLPPTFLDRFVATWDILDPDLEVVARGTFLESSSADLELKPGSYHARVQLPSNQTQSKKLVVESNTPVQVRFTFATRSRPEWLEWATVSEGQSMVEDRRPSPVLQGLHVRSFGFRAGAWEPTSHASGGRLDQTDGILQLELVRADSEILALHIGSDLVRPRFVILPAMGLARVLITEAPAPNESDLLDIEVAVSLQNSIADHLVRFLTIASPSTWEGLDTEMVREQTMNLLRDKRNDPLGAAIGGYFLVDDRSEKPPLDWLRHLANWSPWLADGAILYAQAALRFKQRSGVQEAVDSLARASANGYPVFRRGIDICLDVWRVLKSSDISLPSEVEELAERFAAVRAATTRQSVFTTFFGARPDAPGSTAAKSSELFGGAFSRAL